MKPNAYFLKIFKPFFWLLLLTTNLVIAQTPGIEWFYEDVEYPTFCEPGYLKIRIKNRVDVTNPGAAYNLKFEVGFAVFTGNIPQRHDCIELADFRIESTALLPDSNTLSNYTLLLSTLDTNPDGFGGLTDLDGDGEFDDLQVGAEFFLEMAVNFENECLTSCPPTISDLEAFRLRIHGENALSEAFSTDYQKNDFFFFADEQQIFGELAESYECGDEVLLTLSLQRFMIDMSSICIDNISKLYLKLPPTLTPAGDPALIPPFASLTWEMQGDTMVISGQFTSGYLEIPFEAQFDETLSGSNACAVADSVGQLYDIPFWLHYFCEENCDNFWQLYCGESDAFSVHCNEIPNGATGIFTQNFTAERVTLGWTDSLMTQKVNPTTSGLRLDNALEFDQIKFRANALVSGMVSPDVLTFNWQYQQLGNANSTVFDFQMGTFYLFKNSTQTWQECELNPPAQFFQNGLFKRQFDCAPFFQANGCLNGLFLEEGDSLICEFLMQVKGDIPAGFHKVNQLQGYFSFEQNNEVLACGVAEANLNVIGIHGVQQVIAQPEIVIICDQIQVNTSFYFGHEGFGIFDDFPSEFRLAGMVDSIVIPLPQGLEYIDGSAQLLHTWRPPGSILATENLTTYISNPALIMDGGVAKLVFKNEGNWPRLDYTKAKSFYALIFDLIPTCQLTDSPLFLSLETYYKSHVWAEDPSFFEANQLLGYFNISPQTDFPNIILLDSVFSNAADLANWTFQICNENASHLLPYVWIGLETLNEGFEAVEILENGVALPVLLYENGEGWWVQLGDLGASECREIEVRAQFKHCDFDTLLVRRGFNCSTYPLAPDVGYTSTNYSCPLEMQTDTLFLENILFEAELTLQNALACQGDTNGVLLVETNIEPLGLLYQWSQNLPMAIEQNGLSAGIYEVTVTNEMGCIDSVVFELNAPPVFSASTAIDSDYTGFSVSCFDSTDGVASAQALGGVSPYIYEWSNGSTQAEVLNLPQGITTVTIIDANGCSIIDSLFLTAPMPLNIEFEEVDPVVCQGTATGNIFTTTLGGLEPYSYLWQNGVTTANPQNILAGDWSVTITDANACTSSIATEVPEPISIELPFLSQDVTCHGALDGQILVMPMGGTMPYTFIWNTGATSTLLENLPAGDYTLTITDAVGCTATNSIVLEAPETPLDLMLEMEQISCEGAADGQLIAHVSGGTSPFQFHWNTSALTNEINNLSPGFYEVTVTDAHQCQVIESAQISELDFPELLIEQFPISCFGNSDGEIVLSTIAGVDDLAFSLDGVLYQSEPFFSDLKAGNYTVFVKDNIGCIQSYSTILEAPQVLSVVLPSEIQLPLGTTAMLSPQANQVNLQWQWFPPKNLSCTDCLAPEVAPFRTTTYTVIATNQNGCTAEASTEILVSLNTEQEVYVPNAFSPNGDGANDYLKVYAGASVATISAFRIFDRWGGLVFETKNLPSTEDFLGWDGAKNGVFLSSGTFIYELEIERVDGNQNVLKGEVVLVR